MSLSSSPVDHSPPDGAARARLSRWGRLALIAAGLVIATVLAVWLLSLWQQPQVVPIEQEITFVDNITPPPPPPPPPEVREVREDVVPVENPTPSPSAQASDTPSADAPALAEDEAGDPELGLVGSKNPGGLLSRVGGRGGTGSGGGGTYVEYLTAQLIKHLRRRDELSQEVFTVQVTLRVDESGGVTVVSVGAITPPELARSIEPAVRSFRKVEIPPPADIRDRTLSFRARAADLN